MSDGKTAAFWFLFSVGAVVALTNLFAPVHELGHVLYARIADGGGSFKGWNGADVAPNLSHAISGYHFEVAVFCLAGLFIGLASRPAGSFFLGHAAMTMVSAFVSYDFYDYVLGIGEYEGLDSFQVGDLLRAVRGRWVLICVIWSFIMAIAIVRWHKKNRPKAAVIT